MTEVRLGEKRIPFIYQGDELIHPAPVKDGLILWYDFSAMSNNDTQRDVAEDLSGNGNHGTLQNFNFTAESGYNKNKLLFDGVDDRIVDKEKMIPPIFTYESTFNTGLYKNNIGGVFGNYRRGSSGSGGNISTYGYSGSNSIRFYYINSENKEATLHYLNYPENTMVHVVFVSDGISEKLYINGALAREAYNGFIANTETSLGFELGIWSDYSPYMFDGKIGSVKAYGRPLTPEEIEHNYAIEKERFGIE